VDWVRGFGRLAGPGRVEVQGPGGGILETRNVVVATGSEALLLAGLAADGERILTNVEILSLAEVPKSLAIVGAGAVGVEFASIFRRLGSEVTLLEMLPRIVPLEDEEISIELRRLFKKSGIRVETGARVEEVRRTDGGVTVRASFAGGKAESIEAEKLLVAAGRRPATGGVGLESTKVERDNGYIRVNEWMQTAEPGVYAIGDVVAGSPQLAHVAAREGLVAVGHIAGRPAAPLNARRIPQVQDWIADDLSRAVVGHVAAAVRLVEGDARPLKRLSRGQQMLPASVPPQGDDVRVLEDQQLVGDCALFAFLDQRALQQHGCAVFHPPQVMQFAARH
jgi:dihydrolipoamide dehydrogenase